MNCPDCRDRLQQWLDARTREAATTPGEPPALCPACAEWGAAARRLDRGLRLLAPPTPPAFLTSRIVARVAAERRRRRMRRFLAVGVARPRPRPCSSACGYVFIGRIRSRPDRPTLGAGPGHPEPPRATLRDSVTEAGSAVAALTIAHRRRNRGQYKVPAAGRDRPDARQNRTGTAARPAGPLPARDRRRRHRRAGAGRRLRPPGGRPVSARTAADGNASQDGLLTPFASRSQRPRRRRISRVAHGFFTIRVLCVLRGALSIRPKERVQA